MKGWGRAALAGAICCVAWGCDQGPPVKLSDDPVGHGLLGTGGAGEEGIAEPGAERPLHWARGPDGTLRGEVVTTEFRRLVVDDAGGQRHYLSISPGTVIRRNGEPSSALVLEPGTQVEATYLTWKGNQVVAEVRVVGPPTRAARK